MIRHLVLFCLYTLSLSAGRLLQSQELTSQAFANNFGDKFITQVEGNVRADTEESHAAGYNMSSLTSNSDSLLHGQLQRGDALAGSETTSRGTGYGLTQTQNETFSREKAQVSGVLDELNSFLDSFGEDKYIRSINGVATDGANTTAGAVQKIFKEPGSTRRSGRTNGTAKWGAGVAGQLTAIEYAGKRYTNRNDVSATGQDLRVATVENNWLEGNEIKGAGAGFSDSAGPQPASASSGSAALEGDGVINARSRSESKPNLAKARTYTTSNPDRDQ